MSVSIRPVETSDLNIVVDLLMLDAEQRYAKDQTLWKLEANAREKVASTIKTAMANENPPFRQRWLVAETCGDIVGITHTILLPVPPIYAGELGAPGLIMEDCFVSEGAPADTSKFLLAAAEADLVEAGAKNLLASSTVGGAWEAEYAAQNYAPLTLYLAKVGLNPAPKSEGVRNATEDDVPAIVASSSDNRQILFDLDEFWKPHPEADVRFGSWMARSLTLTDRDMFVSEAEGDFEGYVISQPATPLHFPTPHDVGEIGVIDDYYHTDFENPTVLAHRGRAASDLLQAAEAALDARGNTAALIVCPAAWASKISVLKDNGYDTAIVWFIKR